MISCKCITYGRVEFLEESIEIWKDIPNFEGIYRISSLGKIKNRKGVILKGNAGSTGYLHVNLPKDEGYKTLDIHRTVAILFVPNPNNCKYVNHIDGIKKNNKANNLEWVTARQNTAHAIKLGLRKDYGSNSSNSKLTENDVLEIRRLSSVMTNKELSLKFNVSFQYIPLILYRKRWSYLK